MWVCFAKHHGVSEQMSELIIWQMNPLLGSFNTGDLKRQRLPLVGQLAMGPPGRVLS